MPQQRRDFHVAQPRRDRAFDDATEAFVIQTFEDVGDQARRAGANARPFARRRLEEAAGGSGDIEPLHPPGNHRRNEEVLLEEGRERLADPILIARDDRGVRDGQAKRVAEQRRDGEPVGEAADHGRLGEGFGVAEPGLCRFQSAREGEHGGHDEEQAGGDDLHPLRARLRGIEAGQSAVGHRPHAGSIAEPAPRFIIQPERACRLGALRCRRSDGTPAQAAIRSRLRSRNRTGPEAESAASRK